MPHRAIGPTLLAGAGLDQVIVAANIGAIESSVSPGFIHITRSWYKRSEQPLRLGIWYSATGLFSIFSGLVNYGLGKAGTRPGAKLHAWKYMFLFAGSLTILFGLLMLLLLPSSPLGDALLSIPGYNRFSPEQKSLAAGRLRSNITGEAELDDDATLRTSHAEENKHDEKDDSAPDTPAAATCCSSLVSCSRLSSTELPGFGAELLQAN